MEVVIVAYGIEYVIMAINNARTIRATNPSLSIRLITNAPPAWTLLLEEFDHVEHRNEPTERNRFAKIRVYAATDSDRVLYLDADAEVRGDLTPLFGFLERHDLLLRAFDLPSKFRHLLREDLDGQLYPQFWGGMFCFRRNEATRKFFAAWEDRYITSGLARDQPALARAIFDVPEVRLSPMNATWGIFSANLPSYPANRPAPRIYHYADVSDDQEVLRRCRGILQELLLRLPESAQHAQGLAQTQRRFTRISSLAYRSPLLRTAALRWWWRSDRRAGQAKPNGVKKFSETAGDPLSPSDRPLWTD